MPTKGLVPLILLLAAAGPAAAEVKSAASNGFEVTSVATIAASTDRVYSALGKSAIGGAPLTPSRAMPPTSASNYAPAAAFARGSRTAARLSIDKSSMLRRAQRLKKFVEGKLLPQ